MKVTREVLLKKISGVYATGVVRLKGHQYYAFASENRDGGLYLVDTETNFVWQIDGCSGGVMGIVDAADEDAFICIEEFYPVFDSENAKLVRYTVAIDNGHMEVTREVFVEIPYIHRVAQVCGEDGIYLAAGRLCKHKECVDDWSTSGSMEIGRYDQKNPRSIDFKIVHDGIYKHHALWIKCTNGTDELYYGGTEGVFHSLQRGGVWFTEQVISASASDIVVEDLDGDGKDELVIIEGFHGSKCTIFKMENGTWARALELPMDFGHVLWGGSFLGDSALIMGSRAGNKQLILNRFEMTDDGGIQVREETVIDMGQAPAQITVIGEETGTSLIAANHGAGQAVLYRFG